MFRAKKFLAQAALCFLAASPALDPLQATTLEWGINGNGGSGYWSYNSNNWWNGSQNIRWQLGSDLVFGGQTGTVTVTDRFTANSIPSITFDTAGYIVEFSALPDTIFRANADVTIRSGFSAFSASNLTKTGIGTLTLARTFLPSNIDIEQGELLLDSTSSAIRNLSMTGEGGATLTLFAGTPFYWIESLSGGGTVRPGPAASSKEILINEADWHGTIKDNGAGKLALNVAPYTGVTFTNLNTYSGRTFVGGSGIFKLTGAGSIPNSPITLSNARMVLDNSEGPLSNRISDSLPLVFQGGKFEIIGHESTPISENAGNLTIDSAGSLLKITNSGAPLEMRFSELSRIGKGTITIDGQGLTLVGVQNQPSGILTSALTMQNEWATVDSAGHVTAYAAYSQNINSGSPLDHVKLVGEGITHLLSATEKSTLNIQNSADTEHILDLGGHTLTLRDGGLLASGGTSQITNGAIAASNELIVTARSKTTIAANISESGQPLSLTKTGGGELVLSGNNTYSGATSINEGILTISGDQNLGASAAVDIYRGTLRANANFASSKEIRGQFGTIDTAGHDISFAATNIDEFSKTGTGKLTLGSSAKGFIHILEGTLAISNAPSTSVDLRSGILEAVGELYSIYLYGSATIDIGNSQIGTLKTDSFSSGSALTASLYYDLSGTTSDLLQTKSLSDSLSYSFSFRNLGDISLGTEYNLIAIQNPSSFLNLAFSPEAIAAGWSGQFKISPTGISVRFDTVPEPATIVLLVTASAALLLRKRRQA